MSELKQSALIQPQSFPGGMSVPPETVKSFYELAEQLRSGKLKTPPHQRWDDAWPKLKAIEWIQRLIDVSDRKQPPPLGTICVYMLPDTGTVQFLNDGLQRLTACKDALIHPEKYKFRSEDDAAKTLSRCYVPVQNREYNTHHQAAIDFEAVNKGTGLHKAEKYKYKFVYEPKWADWEHQYDRWERSLSERLSHFSARTRSKKSLRDRERSIRHLFAVAHIGEPLNGNADTSEVEEAVARVIRDKRPDDVGMAIEKMHRFAGLMEKAWRDIHPVVSERMNERLAMWCIGVMCLNEDVGPFFWMKFFDTLFKRTFGYPKLDEQREGKKTNTYFLTARLGQFHKVVKVLGLEVPVRESRPRPKNGIPGMDWHHIKPFVDHGDGPGEWLPSLLNAAQNARAPLKTSE